jgi:hypothetical protein
MAATRDGQIGLYALDVVDGLSSGDDDAVVGDRHQRARGGSCQTWCSQAQRRQRTVSPASGLGITSE